LRRKEKGKGWRGTLSMVVKGVISHPTYVLANMNLEILLCWPKSFLGRLFAEFVTGYTQDH